MYMRISRALGHCPPNCPIPRAFLCKAGDTSVNVYVLNIHHFLGRVVLHENLLSLLSQIQSVGIRTKRTVPF
jgi:hypothetical protein